MSNIVSITLHLQRAPAIIIVIILYKLLFSLSKMQLNKVSYLAICNSAVLILLLNFSSGIVQVYAADILGTPKNDTLIGTQDIDRIAGLGG